MYRLVGAVLVVVEFELVQAVAQVESVRGAVPVFRLDRFSGPLPAPGVYIRVVSDALSAA